MPVDDGDIPRCELCGSEYPNDPGAALACCSELEPIELDDVQEDDRLRVAFRSGDKELEVTGTVDDIEPSDSRQRDVRYIELSAGDDGRFRVVAGGAVWDINHPDPEIYIQKGYFAELKRRSSVATDGGTRSLRDLDENQDDDLVDACPECGYTDIYLRGSRGFNGPAPSTDSKYRCNRCKHDFDEPERRPRRHPGSRQGLAGVLEELGEQGRADAVGGSP